MGIYSRTPLANANAARPGVAERTSRFEAYPGLDRGSLIPTSYTGHKIPLDWGRLV